MNVVLVSVSLPMAILLIIHTIKQANLWYTCTLQIPGSTPANQIQG